MVTEFDDVAFELYAAYVDEEVAALESETDFETESEE